MAIFFNRTDHFPGISYRSFIFQINLPSNKKNKKFRYEHRNYIYILLCHKSIGGYKYFWMFQIKTKKIH